MPESVEQCVRSVIDEESVSESSAYAICWARYNAGELKEDDDFEFGPVTDDDESEEDWTEEEKSRNQLRHIAGGLYNSYSDLDKNSSWSIGLATLAAEKAGMEDPLGVKSVAYKTVTGEWPSIHPSETTKNGRDHLWETYKYAVDKILGGGEVAKTLSKSNSMEKVDFTADFAGTQTVFKADDDFVIWGPASVEIVDKEGDRIHADALKEALPQLLKRGRLSLEHSDQLVGEIIESYELENEVELQIDGESYKRKEFPTDVIELDGKKPALYVAGRIYDDSRQSKRVRESIENGELNSYSISGEALVSRSKIEQGEPVNDIVEIDLSAVTVCEEGMNQGAKFATVAKEESETVETPNVLTIKSESGHVAVSKSDDVGNEDNPTEHPGDRTLTIQRSKQYMSDETEKSEGNPQEVTLDELKSEFQTVVKDALTEEDFAKEDDILSKDEVEGIVEELVQEKMDELETSDDVEKDAESEDDVEKTESLTEDDVRSIAQEVSKESASQAVEEVLERQAEEEEEEEEEEKGYDDEEEEEEEEKQSGMSEEDLAAALADIAGVDADEARDAIDALQSKQNGGHSEEEEEEEEEKAEGEDSEEEEEDEKANGEEEEEEEAEADKGGSQYTVQELKEKLPEDVFDAVRGYIGEEKAEKAEKSEGQHPDFDFDLDEAVEKAINDKLGTAGTPATPSGSTEKSYDDEDGDSVGNPALAIWSDN